MNFKYTPQTLSRLEKIFEGADYVLRYEKGTFNSGYCVLEHKKVVVVNRFLDTEGRINTLADILTTLVLPEEKLDAASLKLYRQIAQEQATQVSDATDIAGDEDA